MRTTILGAALACATLVFTSTAAFAEGGPIQGTEVGLEHDPAGIAIPGGVTDSNGSVTFRNLAPGKYVVSVRGKDVGAAMDRARHSGGQPPGLTIAIVGGAVAAAVTTPYCPEAAGRDVRVGFTIPDRAGAVDPVVVRVGISDDQVKGWDF